MGKSPTVRKNNKFEFSAKTHFLVVYMGLRLKMHNQRVSTDLRAWSVVQVTQPPRAPQTGQAGLRKGRTNATFYRADQPITRQIKQPLCEI